MKLRATGIAAFMTATLLASPAPAEDQVPAAAVRYAVTPEKIADVRITEESPGRFIAIIDLVEKEKKALSEATATHVGENIEVTIADEPVLLTAIRGPMDSIALGPWMNEGLANLFAKCLEQCGSKKCL